MELQAHEESREALAPSRPRFTDVVSDLRDLAITSFDVPLDRLASLLPRGIDAERFDAGEGPFGLVSAVSFRNLDFHVGFAPFVRIDAAQTNFRAYVRVRGVSSIYFFGTSFGSRTVILPRAVWGLPWRYATHAIDCAFDAEGRCRRFSFHATSAFGEERLEATGTGTALTTVRGFRDEATTRRVLADPTIGYVRTRRGTTATYGVDHPPLDLERADVTASRFELFETLGLVRPGQAPSSVYLCPSSRFVVRLPPRRISLDD